MLSLAKRIVSIITNNRENRLKELKEHLLDRKHPQHIIDNSFTKIFQPKFQTENNNSITFIRTYNPKHNINLKKFHSCLAKNKNRELKTCFQKKKVLLSTRQPPNLRNFLTKAKFERLPMPKQIKQVEFFRCTNCIYHKNVYFKECLSFLFKSKNKLLTWHYRRFCSCDSKDVLYVLICNNYDFFYIGQTEESKQRTRKHKSDVIHPNNSNCKKFSKHLRTCSKIKEPYFNIYPFLYEENNYLREFKERRYIMNWQQQLNSYQ